MPFLAQMRQLLFARLRNKTQKWEATNDLMDILFLTWAAGYADIVVAKRATITYLRQASTPRPKARLAKSLTDAVTLLIEVKCRGWCLSQARAPHFLTRSRPRRCSCTVPFARDPSVSDDAQLAPARDDYQSPAARKVARLQPPTGASVIWPGAPAAPRRPNQA
jgi:hypothetical protein